MGIDSVFRSVAGADWKSSDGDGLSAAEFGAFLKDKAGADGKFNGSEFSATAKSLGLSGEESKAIFQAFGKDGQISVDKFRDLLEKYAGSDKAFNLDELKGGLDKLAARAERKNGEDGAPPAADFGRDAGADKAMDESEFKALCKKAGIDEDTAEKAFKKAAGADGEISRDEFEKAFGGSEAGEGKFKSKVKELAGDKESFAKFGRDAGADGKMDKSEFKALARKAGVSDDDADKAFDKIAGADGKISKDEFKADGGLGSGEISKSDFKSKVKKIAGGDKEPFADFGRDAGADGRMDESEFKALAKKAGVSDEDADKAFDRIAGADGKISREEFKADDGLGGVEVSDDTFRSKVEAASSAG